MRAGTSIVEIMVATVVLSIAATGTWFAFTGLQRQSNQVADHLGILQAASSVEARLSLDAASLCLPGGTLQTIQVDEEGSWISFLVTPQSSAPESAPASGVDARRVRWSALPASDGAYRLVREVVTPGHEERLEWASPLLSVARFSLASYSGRHFLTARLLFRGSSPEGATSSRRGLPLRWLYQVPTRPRSFFSDPAPAALRVLAGESEESASRVRLEVPSW